MIRKAGENRRSAVPPAGDIVGWEDPRDKPPTFPELREANITRGVNLPATDSGLTGVCPAVGQASPVFVESVTCRVPAFVSPGSRPGVHDDAYPCYLAASLVDPAVFADRTGMAAAACGAIPQHPARACGGGAFSRSQPERY